MKHNTTIKTQPGIHAFRRVFKEFDWTSIVRREKCEYCKGEKDCQLVPIMHADLTDYSNLISQYNLIEFEWICNECDEKMPSGGI